MLAFCLQRQGRTKQRFFTDALGGAKIRHARLPLRNRARFIQRHDLHLSCLLQRRCVFEKNAVARPEPVSDHNGNRRCKPERARAADHKHGNAARKRIAEVFSEQQPYRKRRRRNPDHNGNKHPAHPVRNFCDRRLGCRRIAHHCNEFGKRGILADALCAAHKIARAVYRRRADLISDRFICRNALARQCRFVDSCRALCNDPVRRNIFPRAHNKAVPDFHLLNRNGHLFAVPQKHRCFRRKPHQGTQRIRGFSFGMRLQHFADGDQC